MPEMIPGNYLDDENLFSQFCQQLKKDFEGAGLEFDDALLLPHHYELLKMELAGRLARIAKNGGQQIAALLYRVDISEQHLTRQKMELNEKSYETILSELIIKRVLQKVILRRNFS